VTLIDGDRVDPLLHNGNAELWNILTPSINLKRFDKYYKACK
jgi:hypothetical protein